MKTFTKIGLGSILIVLLAVTLASAHCQVPCGIYDDAARINLIREDITTVEKAMNQVHAIQKNLKEAGAQDYNQLVRWINNKEEHAQRIQDTVAAYFLAQRIKLDDKKYDEKLSVLHEITVYAMKCKQTVDLEHVKKLRELVDLFEKLYFGKSE